jgi:hypothetical protein
MVVPHHGGGATDGDGGGNGDGVGDSDVEAEADTGPGRKEMVMFTLKPPMKGSLDKVSVRNIRYTRAPGVVETKGPGRLAVRFPVRRSGLGGGTASGSRYSTSVS